MHHLALRTRRVAVSFLPIESIRLRGAITKMLNFPPFMRAAVNPAGGRGFNSVLAQGLRKLLSPTLEIRLSWIQTDPIEPSGLHDKVHMRMRRGTRIWIGLERVEHHGVLKPRKLPLGEVTSGPLNRQRIGPLRHGEDEMKGVAHRGIRSDRHAAIRSSDPPPPLSP